MRIISVIKDSVYEGNKTLDIIGHFTKTEDALKCLENEYSKAKEDYSYQNQDKIVYDYDEETQIATCKQRNKFVKGDKLEILSPGLTGEEFEVVELFNEEGEAIDECPHPGMMCKVKIPYKVKKNSFIRKALGLKNKW